MMNTCFERNNDKLKKKKEEKDAKTYKKKKLKIFQFCQIKKKADARKSYSCYYQNESFLSGSSVFDLIKVKN